MTVIDSAFPEFVPMVRFGKDHWTTFAYAETCCVDGDGVLQPERMRCNARRHRTFAWNPSGDDYPTRLKDGILEKHDDWDCLQDLEAGGLLEIVEENVVPNRRLGFRSPSTLFPILTCRVKITPLGWRVAEQLRRHLAETKRSRDFVPELSQPESPNLVLEVKTSERRSDDAMETRPTYRS